MSDSLEIVEITDTSINPDALAELDVALESTTKTKRQLDDSDLDEKAAKKICPDVDITDSEIVANETVIDGAIVNESKAADDGGDEFNEPDILEQNILIDKAEEAVVEADDEDLMVEEVPSKSQVLVEGAEEPDEAEEEGEEEEEDEEDEEEAMAEESFEYRESENEASSDEDDESMMARALNASAKRTPAPAPTKPTFQMDDDEPIALDDSDEDEPPPKAEKYESDSERSSEYSIDNNVIGASDDEQELVKKLKPVKPRVLLARRLVKKSCRFLSSKQQISSKEGNVAMAKEAAVVKEKESAQVEEAKVTNKNVEVVPSTSREEKEKVPEEEAMDVSDVHIEETTKIVALTEKPILPEHKPENGVDAINDKSNKKPVENIEKKVEPAKPDELVNNKSSSAEHSNESSHHESSLLTEITNSSMEEVFNRYILKNTEQSPTLDEFSEELFYCLQQNNQEIEKARLLWNERLHVKYKIRELMETIRRHRAVMEIETFGYKPENAGNNSHPVISSKSSTTTNSETDPYDKNFRMSSESVSRLIQDVRATMLKRDDKNRVDESTTNATDNSLASQWNNLQANSAQGRQGQIIDVQSIINDFRQKNPQEIPRRGRRMKNSFGGAFYDNQQSLEEQRAMRNEFLSNVTNNSHEFNSTMKANQSNAGYPEVSLHPVQNLYKNLANASGASGSGVGHFGGQKSSLLQSILTKQSTKSPVGFHQNHPLPTTSTLARLLTAPERSFQGAPKQQHQPPPRQSSNKVHNNGEITITPIGLNNPRNKDYSMEDDENSMEPPLVIDEAEDFDSAERGALKSVSDLLCQGCKKNKAFFMCAGCSRQWYCSKECQEMAWDDHAESCAETVGSY